MSSSYQESRKWVYSFRLVLTSFLQTDGLPFANLLGEERINREFAKLDALFGQDNDCIFTPAITLWALLSQVLFKKAQRSCLAAVARVVTLLSTMGIEPCVENSGPYCRARAKIPTVVVSNLTRGLAQEAEQQVPDSWLLHGRSVALLDGTDVTLPDTCANQEEYPQPNSQAPGLGFPMVRMVLLFSLATGMVLDMKMGPYQGKETGETALFRQMLSRIDPGTIVVADRYYCSYFMVALLNELNIDFVVRLHQRRAADFRRGRRLGKGDHVVRWDRPARPEWMDEDTYARMPEFIEVREVQVNVTQPGYRSQSFVVVTTLHDAETYTKQDIAELYHQRWLAELDIRSIKVTLGMDELRCKTPEMVRKEIWTCLLAYNLIRYKMLQGAITNGTSPREVSLSLALNQVAASYGVAPIVSEQTAKRLAQAHIEGLGGTKVGNRPGRVEPRAIKRRPKQHKLLTIPRDEARAQLLDNHTD